MKHDGDSTDDEIANVGGVQSGENSLDGADHGGTLALAGGGQQLGWSVVDRAEPDAGAPSRRQAPRRISTAITSMHAEVPYQSGLRSLLPRA
jgi:hypothetical protein